MHKVSFSAGKPHGKCCAIVSPNLSRDVMDTLASIDNLRVTTDTSGLFIRNENVYLLPDERSDEIKICFE